MRRPAQATRARSAAAARAAEVTALLAFGLCADGFGDLDVDRGEPVMAVGPRAVHDAEELVVQRLGDGAHGSVANQNAVDRAEVGDLGGSTGEEGFVGDIEQ